MLNLLNKDRNKTQENDIIQTTREILSWTQQSERRHRLQQLAKGYRSGVTRGDHSTTGVLIKGANSLSRSREQLIEEVRERRKVIKGAKEELVNLYTTLWWNSNGREKTSTA